MYCEKGLENWDSQLLEARITVYYSIEFLKKNEFVFSKTASDYRAGYKQAAVTYRTLKPELIQESML